MSDAITLQTKQLEVLEKLEKHLGFLGGQQEEVIEQQRVMVSLLERIVFAQESDVEVQRALKNQEFEREREEDS